MDAPMPSIMARARRRLTDWVKSVGRGGSTNDAVGSLHRSIASSRQLRWARWILCLLSTTAFAFVTSGAIYFQWTTFAAVPFVGERPFNELTKAAIELRLDQAKTLTQLGLLALGALWALVISKKDEAGITLRDRPELLMFVEACLSLLLSFASYTFYATGVSDAYALAGQTCAAPPMCIPDVFDPRIDDAFRFQWWFVLLGIVIAALTLVSAHRLRERS
jgi:hypothetical protein